MSEIPDGRPRPTPRPRPAVKPSPRPRVAGSRRERDEPGVTQPEAGARRERPTRPGGGGITVTKPGAATATARPRASRTARVTALAPAGTASGRRLPALALVLALLCLAAAVGGGYLLWQRLNPAYVDSSIFAAARDGVQALYAYDYENSEGSVQGKLDVLTGELRDQYEKDLTQGGIIDTYEQVSATTRYEVLDVGLKQVNEAQDVATVVVFGQYVVESVNSGSQPAPEQSGCQVTPAGAQSCTQTVRATLVELDGEWKISELTVVTSS
jgi:hypothetical protein